MTTKEILTENLHVALEESYQDAFYITPDIPEKKMNNAIKYIAEDCSKKDIIAVVDGTIFGSVKEGFVFTDTRFYAKVSGTKLAISYTVIGSMKADRNKIVINTKEGNTVFFRRLNILSGSWSCKIAKSTFKRRF